MSDLQNRLTEVEIALSINHSLMTAALNPDVAGLIKDRIAKLQAERTEILTMIEGAA